VAAVKQFTYMDQLHGTEVVELEPGIRDTVRVLASKARSKGVSVAIDVEPGLPSVRANAAELNQVWMNLIDNALDAVGDSGKVEIAARSHEDRVVVRVVDDGPGIPDDVIGKVFDAFFTTKAPGDGTGLGLEIARQIVRRHRGDIAVVSRPGRTEFSARLPAAETPRAG
jgi:signal transduction histidine kinase